MQLREYQRRAVDWLRAHPRAGLFVEMGLGKTAITLSALTEEHLPALVVAPPRVAEYTWPEEARRWRPDLKVVYTGTRPVDRERILHEPADVYVTSMNVLHTLPPDRWEWRTVIFDESSCFKDYSSKRTKAALDLAAHADYTVLLTGTPVTQSILDLYTQAKMIDGGQRLGRTLTTFRESWMRRGAVVARTSNGTLVYAWEPRDGAEEEIKERLSDVTLTLRARDHIELPGESTQAHEVRLNTRQWSAYKTLEREFLVELDGQDILAPTSADLSSKLRQILAGAVKPSPDGEPVRLSDERVMTAVDLAYQVTGYGPGSRQGGNGAIIWYQYAAERDRLLEAMGEQAALISSPDAINRWRRGEVLALIAHPMAAGHGLNLQDGGNHDIWCSLPWSLEQWQQACARLARSGQQRPVIHHVLQARGPQGQDTLDHRVAEALAKKAEVAEVIMGQGV